MNNELLIYFDIFSNNKYIGNSAYTINIKRNTINRDFFIYNMLDNKNHRLSIAKLYISFVDSYFYSIFITELDKNGIDGYTSQKEDVLVYNDDGILTKTGIVDYSISYSYGNEKITYKSEFIMSKYGEELIIPVKISHEDLSK